jgi:methylthioribulose-1-phosphate dehydratase
MAEPRKEYLDPSSHASLVQAAIEIADAGKAFYSRGWVLGTSGNFSTVLHVDPLRLAISSSGVHKGDMGPDDIIHVDDVGRVIQGTGRPSAETLLHLALVRSRGAGAVCHTHSVWSTLLSDACAQQGGLAIEGFEMLKGLDGVSTHEHSAWLPVIDNSQDMEALARSVEDTLGRFPAAHGFLLRRHGLYTWGKSMRDARRHVEILEFLLEVVGRQGSSA